MSVIHDVPRPAQPAAVLPASSGAAAVLSFFAHTPFTYISGAISGGNTSGATVVSAGFTGSGAFLRIGYPGSVFLGSEMP